MRSNLARFLTVLLVAAVAVFGIGHVTDVDAAATQDVVYVATGENFPDALGVGSVAALNNAPVLFVLKDVIPSATLSELNRLKPSKIIIVGGEGVVSGTVFEALSNLPFNPTVQRLAGADRFATAAAISASRFPSDLDADTLDGLDSGAFLRTTGKAADADKLDGLDSGAFLRTTGKAADADKLDGLNSTAFAQATDVYTKAEIDSALFRRQVFVGYVGSTGTKEGNGSYTSSQVSTGVYNVRFDFTGVTLPANAFPMVIVASPSEIGSCAGDGTATADWTSYSSNAMNFRVATTNGGVLADCGFSFIATFAGSNDLVLPLSSGVAKTLEPGVVCTNDSDGASC